MRLPTFFISHGAPSILLSPSPARTFMEGFAARLPRPRAIVVASAHFMTRQPAVDADPAPRMIYDFGGFPDALYEMVYPAPGEPDLAMRIGSLLNDAGLEPALVTPRGFDHGTWVPLMMMYPGADIPVVQVAVQPRSDPAHHYRMGLALAPLAGDNILVLGSGSASHNLSAFFSKGPPPESPPRWLTEFTDWLSDRVTAGDVATLLDWRRSAPFFEENHPTDEHLLPLMFAMGAAGEGARGERVHASYDAGALALDCYAFR